MILCVNQRDVMFLIWYHIRYHDLSSMIMSKQDACLYWDFQIICLIMSWYIIYPENVLLYRMILCFLIMSIYISYVLIMSWYISYDIILILSWYIIWYYVLIYHVILCFMISCIISYMISYTISCMISYTISYMITYHITHDDIIYHFHQAGGLPLLRFQ